VTRNIPVTNEIKMFFHCKHCLKDKPEGLSPRQWLSIECGWTELGFQVWCKRCDMNIIHVDFEGEQHPASMLGRELSPDRIRLVENESDNQVQAEES
jgi:hypothetical protein